MAKRKKRPVRMVCVKENFTAKTLYQPGREIMSDEVPENRLKYFQPVEGKIEDLLHATEEETREETAESGE